tara:strand:+ start:2911 stop:3102 length:192 start_codon:yes stop_codon:yes gene_type:complete
MNKKERIEKIERIDMSLKNILISFEEMESHKWQWSSDARLKYLGQQLSLVEFELKLAVKDLKR